MTREEAVKEIEKTFEPAFANYIITALIESTTISDKALEQESTLDKIRAEIEQLPTSKCTETYRIYINAGSFKEKVLEIFDKYKVESENKE